MYRVLPSILSPKKTVNFSPSGKVYAIPSTVNTSFVPLRSSSVRGSGDPSALPASREMSRESSPVKLVVKSIW